MAIPAIWTLCWAAFVIADGNPDIELFNLWAIPMGMMLLVRWLP